MGMTKKEIADRIAELKRSLVNQNTGRPATPVPDETILTKSQLADRINQLKSQLSPEYGNTESSNPGLWKRAGQFGRGLLQGIGADIDMLQPSNPALRMAQVEPEQVGGIQQFFPKEAAEIATSKPTAPASEELPRVAGLDERFEPDKSDTLGKTLNLSGKFLSPSALIPGGGYLSAGKKFAEEGVKSGLKALGKEAALSGGAATAISATPKITEEGTAAGTLEDFAKGIFGARISDKIISRNLTKTMAKIPQNIVSRAATIGAKPNERTFELAKKHGVELPFNVGMRSKPMNWLANNYLKSIFTSGVYEDALKNSNESMVNAVKRNIDELGNSNLLPHEASGEYRRFIQAEEKAAQAASSELYTEAAKSLKTTDRVRPNNTAKFIENMGELLGRDIQSPATKKVANIVGNLSESWGIAPSGKTLDELEKNPKLIKAYLDAFKKRLPSVPIEKLIGVRKELGTITNFDPTVKGSEAYLNGLKGAIDKDISLTKNTEFLDKWRFANSEFKKNVADRFRGDIARSLLSHEMPREAYSLLNTPANIKELQKIAGKNEKSMEVFNALKKAKVREIFTNSLQDESLRLSPFVNVFNKKEATSELLAELLPNKKIFNNLSDIAEIAQEFKNANQELLNTSRTALTASEIEKSEKIVKGALSLLCNGVGGSLIGLNGFASAAFSAAVPNLLSRLVANPKFVNDARAYAIARKNGREVYADTLLKRLINLTDAEQRLMMSELKSSEEDKD